MRRPCSRRRVRRSRAADPTAVGSRAMALSRCPSSGATAPPARAGRRGLGRRPHPGRPRCPRAPSAIRDALVAAGAPVVEARAPTTTRALLAVHDAALRRVPRAAPGAPGRRPGFPATRARTGSSPYIFPHARAARRARAGRPGRARGAHGLLRLRHDDADRPGHLGGGARGGRRRADRGRPRARRRARRLRLLPPARPPRDAQRLRRLVLPEQRRDRGGAAPRGTVPGGSRSSTSTRTTATARRRSSASAPTCSRARCTSTPAPAGSRTSSASRGEAERAGANLQRAARRRAPATTAGWRAVARARRRGAASTARDALVVALGVDAAGGDPESPLRRDARPAIARRGSSLGGARPADRRRAGGRLRPRGDRRARARRPDGPRGGAAMA